MLANVNVLKLPGKYEDSYKWPKLSECAEHYKVPVKENELHGSYYDVLVMFRVFYQMTKHPETKDKVFQFMKGKENMNKQVNSAVKR